MWIIIIASTLSIFVITILGIGKPTKRRTLKSLKNWIKRK
jgi:hypothetical protein